MLNITFSESVMSKTRVYEWYKRFPEVCDDDEHLGCPSTSRTDDNFEKVNELIMNVRQITIREVPGDVGIFIGSCHEICGEKKSWLFHLDNAPAHTSLLVRDFFYQRQN